jgi:hypothetical protein
MSWTRYLFHDYFTAREFNRLDERLRHRRMSEARSGAEQRRRIDELEDDLGRLTLLVHALAEACVRKGMLTRPEIAALVDELDLLDGRADGKLDLPAPGEPGEARPQRPATPEGYLHELEKGDAQTPDEFLADLQRGDADDRGP